MYGDIYYKANRTNEREYKKKSTLNKTSQIDIGTVYLNREGATKK